jgi:hypothetical protein
MNMIVELNMDFLPVLKEKVTLTQALEFAHEKDQRPVVIAGFGKTWLAYDSGTEFQWLRCAFFPESEIQEAFCRGFAWINTHNTCLAVDWPKMMQPEWTVLDLSSVAVLHFQQVPFQNFHHFVKKRDEHNCYNYEKSEIAKQCAEEINKELNPIGFLVDIFTKSNIPELIGPEKTTIKDRLLATKIFSDTLTQIDKEI